MKPNAAALFAFALFVASGLLCPRASEAQIFIPCGANVNSYTSSYPAGTTFQLAGTAASPCTYSGQTFHTRNNDTIQGDCSSGIGANTIFDGGGTSALLTSGIPAANGGDNTSGVVLQCLTIQNYGGSKSATTNDTPQLNTWNQWVVQNCTLQMSGGWGINMFGSSVLRNCVVGGNFQGGIGIGTELLGYDGLALAVVGNAILSNNLRHDNPNFDGSGLKGSQVNPADPGTPQGVQVLNNYVNNNYGMGIWCDYQSQDWIIQGNTVNGNFGNGILFETCNSGDISHNVVNNNGWSCIFVNSGSNATVHENNCLVSTTQSIGIMLQASCRADAQVEKSNYFYLNTVSFLDGPTTSPYEYTDGFDDETGATWGTNRCPSYPTPPSLTANTMYNNTYYLTSLNEPHWIWGNNWPDQSLRAIQLFGGYGVEAESTQAVGNGSVSGCTQVGCTGSGW